MSPGARLFLDELAGAFATWGTRLAVAVDRVALRSDSVDSYRFRARLVLESKRVVVAVEYVYSCDELLAAPDYVYFRVARRLQELRYAVVARETAV